MAAREDEEEDDDIVELGGRCMAHREVVGSDNRRGATFGNLVVMGLDARGRTYFHVVVEVDGEDGSISQRFVLRRASFDDIKQLTSMIATMHALGQIAPVARALNREQLRFWFQHTQSQRQADASR